MKESIACLFVSFQAQGSAEIWSELKTVVEGYAKTLEIEWLYTSRAKPRQYDKHIHILHQKT